MSYSVCSEECYPPLYLTAVSYTHLDVYKRQAKCYIWSVALYGGETWTLRKEDRKGLKLLKCGCGEEWKELNGKTEYGMRK